MQPFHVAAFVKDMEGHVATPTVKQHLAAIRMLFDWLVTGRIKYVVKKGKLPC